MVSPRLIRPGFFVCCWCFVLCCAVFLFCFAEEMLGLSESKALVTNERLLELMHPSNPGLPYIYEDFSNWGNTATDLP